MPKKMSVNLKKCVNCTKCADVCESGAIKDTPVGLIFCFDKCNFCEKCVGICPENALLIQTTIAIEETALDMLAL